MKLYIDIKNIVAVVVKESGKEAVLYLNGQTIHVIDKDIYTNTGVPITNVGNLVKDIARIKNEFSELGMCLVG